MPRAITMWDFSWLERRWPGAGYENWDNILDECIERGYNAIRIDAYPHLLAADSEKTWTLKEVWNQQDWGSPDLCQVQIQPALNTFLSKCLQRDIKVGLSSWFREDVNNIRMKIDSSEKMADIWIKTLESISADNLLDAILYVDLCNEWPGDLWAPYFVNEPPELTWTGWHTRVSMAYMKQSIELIRAAFPQLPYCYSFTGGQPALYAEKDLSFFDFIEHHVWMAQLNADEYYKEADYDYDRFTPKAFKNLVKNHRKVYDARPEYWNQMLIDEIHVIAAACKKASLPLITTECWGLVDFKDWPLLDWGLVKDLCELGVRTAAATGQWAAMATSNFAGPQFIGIWRDIDYHQKLTGLIRSSKMNQNLKDSMLLRRL